VAKSKVPSAVIVAYALENPLLSNQQVADYYEISEAAVRRAFAKEKRERPALLGADLPIESPITHFAERDIALAGDLHVPITKWSFLNRFLADMKAEKITTLGIPGDFWNGDGASQFDYKQSAADMETEKKIGNEVMTAMLEQFDHVILSWGNHDARYHKLLKYGVSFTETMQMMFHEVPDHLLSKVEWTNLDHFYVRTAEDFLGSEGQNLWYVCHPKSYSSIPLTQSRRIAAKTLCNVITAHSHHHAVGHDVSGKFTCAEVGGFFDKDRTEYLQRTTQFPNWQNGYAIIRADNTLTMRSETWTFDH
jgi:hypothetical protein